MRRRSGPIRLSVVLDRTFVGGAELLLLELFRHFDPAVVAPHLVCLKDAGVLADDVRAAGVPIDVLARSGRFDLSTVPRLVRAFRRHRTDVVLVTHHARASLTLGRFAARLAMVPANVVAVHDMDLVGIGQRCLPRHDLETLFVSDALVLLAPSQGEYLRREEGVGRFPWRRIPEVVIPNGIPLPPVRTAADRAAARRSLGLGPDEVVIGIVARLAPQKAHDVLLRAVALLAPAAPRLRLVVVGQGERDAELRALAAELGISDRVLFTGLRRDVADLLPAFDVACLSSVHEGAPLSVIEAMAAGLPVVATDCGALRDMVADGAEGFIVPVGDVGALSGRLWALVEDAELRTRLGAAARDRAEREYGIERTVARFEQLFRTLVRA